MRYVIVNKINQEIVGQVVCSSDQIQAQVPDSNHIAIENLTATNSTHYWDSQSGLVPYTDEQKLLKLNKPANAFTQWSNIDLSWIDSRSLDSLKIAKWEEIKIQREAEMDNPILTTPFGDIDVDEKGQKKIRAALEGWREAKRLMPPEAVPQTQDWTMANDSTVAVTYDQLASVSILYAQRMGQVHSHARALKALIFNSLNPQSITWNSV